MSCKTPVILLSVLQHSNTLYVVLSEVHYVVPFVLLSVCALCVSEVCALRACVCVCACVCVYVCMCVRVRGDSDHNIVQLDSIR